MPGGAWSAGECAQRAGSGVAGERSGGRLEGVGRQGGGLVPRDGGPSWRCSRAIRLTPRRWAPGLAQCQAHQAAAFAGKAALEPVVDRRRGKREIGATSPADCSRRRLRARTSLTSG